MPAFHDVYFPQNIDFEPVGGPVFDTTIVTSLSGLEERNVNWQWPLCRYECSYVAADRAARDEVLAFFRARMGRAYAFRFRDWTDYYVGMGIVAGALVHTGAHVIGTGNGARTVWPLEKLYTSGPVTHRRRVTRPDSPVRVYLNGVQQASGWSVDYATGVLTFTSAPASGVSVGWSGTFAVPVRFESDAMRMTALNVDTGEMAGFTLVEVRE